ncbi:hypothetical protein VP01_1828g8 [Puccinia sorghi]|uniref:Uncharacterized protein n=1 Tax=Puccinia sorghi TaxID=27349 RepID=A0A0L6VFS9_9BASI|nr:hypothetical protein VP01_1828g8 [Puccinia sorghi]
MKFCTCSRCAASTSSNPQQPISGMYISARNFAKHRVEEQKRILEAEANKAHHMINDPSSEKSHKPSSESDSTEYSEDSSAFCGFDENEDSFHLTAQIARQQ